MTQEEKDLLLKDICGRLPYGTLVYAQNDIDWYESEICTQVLSDVINDDYVVKPYLFPLSSLVDEQIEELESLMEVTTISKFGEVLSPTPEYFDWLNKNHFDWRGLIEKGLAIDATGKNIY